LNEHKTPELVIQNDVRTRRLRSNFDHLLTGQWSNRTFLLLDLDVAHVKLALQSVDHAFVRMDQGVDCFKVVFVLVFVRLSHLLLGYFDEVLQCDFLFGL
jgi:hypothetical protein